jgi:hypothetical protein
MGLIYNRLVLTGLIWLRIGAVEGSCDHSSDLLGCIKCWGVLEQLHNWQFFKKGSAS